MNPQLILAPLQGFTDVVFRNVYASHFSGLNEAVAPFISTMGENRLKLSRLRDIFPENNATLFTTPQILGNNAEDFIFLANRIARMGHASVNWNLGCPHSKIAKKKRGSGLLPFPDEIDRFLDRVLGKIKCTISVKVRLGRKDKSEIFDLLPVLNRYPLEEIVVHPRTGIQMYQGRADENAFKGIRHRTHHTLVFNGDITGREKIEKIQTDVPGTNRFMIGRGVLANPFLPGMIKGEALETGTCNQRIKAFHDDLYNAYDRIFSGPSHLTGRMKGFWSFLGPSFQDSTKALKRILKTRDKHHYKEEARYFFDLDLPFSPPGLDNQT